MIGCAIRIHHAEGVHLGTIVAQRTLGVEVQDLEPAVSSRSRRDDVVQSGDTRIAQATFT